MALKENDHQNNEETMAIRIKVSSIRNLLRLDVNGVSLGQLIIRLGR